MLPRARAHPDMVRAMERLAAARPDLCLQPSAVPHGAYTDALPFYLRRLPRDCHVVRTRKGRPAQLALDHRHAGACVRVRPPAGGRHN
jgi:hypothetical protein